MSDLVDFKKTLEALIHGTPVFEGFAPPADLSEDSHGWLSGPEVLDHVIDSVKPPFVLEVGSWKGKSAIHMARKIREHHDDGFVLCVDTWLGSVEHRIESDWKEQLNLLHGRPRLYEQFLTNVFLAGLTDHIIPFPLPSDQAADFLEQANFSCLMIYIDAAHDEANVLSDMRNYWKLLAPNGVMVGDDYDPRMWPGLIRAVDTFTRENAGSINGELIVNAGKWVLQKAATP